MPILRSLNSLPVLWFILSLPALLLIRSWAMGDSIAMDMLHPTGEFSARFMIVAMAISRLVLMFGQPAWTEWSLKRRRSLGLAAFGYAMLHLVFYVIDMEEMEAILAEIDAPGIWTGWLALALFIPMAITSNNPSMRWLKAGWKRLQRLVYPAALLTLVHWLLIHDGVGGALAHFIPLAVLQLLRTIIIYTRRKSTSPQPEYSP